LKLYFKKQQNNIKKKNIVDYGIMANNFDQLHPPSLIQSQLRHYLLSAIPSVEKFPAINLASRRDIPFLIGDNICQLFL
jgi:hypothetical protein